MARAGDAVADMAYFTARDGKPSDYCQKAVCQCDLYVGLIGLRYGSPVADHAEVSYTELEFDTATEAGLVRLVFLLDENAVLPIPAARLHDHEPDRRAKQLAFRERLGSAGLTVRTVATPDQLELALYQALRESQPTMPEAAAGPGEVLLVSRPRYGNFAGIARIPISLAARTTWRHCTVRCESVARPLPCR